jgi:hypothetical protein
VKAKTKSSVFYAKALFRVFREGKYQEMEVCGILFLVLNGQKGVRVLYVCLLLMRIRMVG